MTRTSTRRAAIGMALMALLAPTCTVAETATDPTEGAHSATPLQPNIVHILTDDLGWQDVACYYRAIHGKQPVYETPHMDRLAKNGMRFMQAYSPAPSCSPSRAAYMAGQYTPHTGVVHVGGGSLPRAYHSTHAYIDPFYPARLDIDTPVIADVLKEAGYVTAHIQKWHLGGRAKGYPGPVDYGFDFSWVWRGQNYNDPQLWDPADKKRADYEGLWRPTRPDRISDFAASYEPKAPYALDPNDDDRPFDAVVDLSVRWMDKVKDQGKPFFLNFCPSFVHGPIATRDRKRLEHYCQKMGVPFPTDPGKVTDKQDGQVNPYYAAMVDSVDWQVGKILTFLETTDDPRNPGHKLIDNTYLMLTSDNGGCVRLPIADGKGSQQRAWERVTDNAPLRAGKQEVYEGGIRIPFIIQGPGIAAGSVNDTPIHLIDMFPTYMAMAGRKPKSDLHIDGCNVLPVFHGEDTQVKFADGSTRESLFFHYPVVLPASSVIRKGGWKLLLYHAAGMDKNRPQVQLFKLYNEDGSPNDLSETENLATTNPAKRDELLKELHDWLDKYDAVRPYKNAHTPGRALSGADKVPAVVKLHSTEDRVEVQIETGDGKAKVVEAMLIYTTNGSDLLRENKHQEEWFAAPATVREGVASAIAPPGMTHGVFYLRDENNFLITSDPIPPAAGPGADPQFQGVKDLPNGYAWRPGLISLINLGVSAEKNAQQAGFDTATLGKAIQAAKSTVDQPVEEKSYALAMRRLRKEIRTLDVPEATLAELNQFQTTKW